MLTIQYTKDDGGRAVAMAMLPLTPTMGGGGYGLTKSITVL